MSFYHKNKRHIDIPKLKEALKSNDFVVGTGHVPLCVIRINVTVDKLFSEELNLTKHQNK